MLHNEDECNGIYRVYRAKHKGRETQIEWTPLVNKCIMATEYMMHWKPTGTIKTAARTVSWTRSKNFKDSLH